MYAIRSFTIDLQYAQSAAVVSLVEIIALHVQVVINGRGAVLVGAQELRFVEVLHIENQRAGIHAKSQFIDLVTEEKQALRFIQPALVAVCRVGINRLADRITSYNVCYTKLLRIGQRLPVYRQACRLSHPNVGPGRLRVELGGDNNRECG